MSLLGIAASGDVLGVIKKLWSLIFGHDMPEPLAALVAKFATDEGKIVWAAGGIAWADIQAGKSFDEAAADAWQTIKDQATSMAISDLEDAIGIRKRA